MTEAEDTPVAEPQYQAIPEWLWNDIMRLHNPHWLTFKRIFMISARDMFLYSRFPDALRKPVPCTIPLEYPG